MVGIEQALKKNDLKAIEAIQAREAVAMGVDRVRSVPADYLKKEFEQELAEWKMDAAKPKLRDQAKFQKLVAKAQPLEGLAANDEKFLRGYAVLKSIDSGGPDTEDAVFAIHQRVTAVDGSGTSCDGDSRLPSQRGPASAHRPRPVRHSVDQ